MFFFCALREKQKKTRILTCPFGLKKKYYANVDQANPQSAKQNTHACMHSSILLNQMQIFAHLEEAKQNRTLGHIFDGGRSRSVSRMQQFNCAAEEFATAARTH